MSPDGISVVGTWTPNPADLVCNGEIKQRVEDALSWRIVASNTLFYMYNGLCLLLMPVGVL